MVDLAQLTTDSRGIEEEGKKDIGVSLASCAGKRKKQRGGEKVSPDVQ